MLSPLNWKSRNRTHGKEEGEYESKLKMKPEINWIVREMDN